MTDDRLVIALDVDGVLNACGDMRKLRHQGFVQHEFTVKHPIVDRMIDLTVRLNPAHGPWLVGLAERLDAELVWATAWNDDANTHIAPAIGLPVLPVIHLAPVMRWKGGAIWKRREVLDWVGTRPLTWLDDQFTSADRGWAGDRDENIAPTKLFRTEEHIGLTAGHLAQIEAWWDRVVGTHQTAED